MATWKADGPRTVVTEEEAQAVVSAWSSEAATDAGVVVLDLSCRTWQRPRLEQLREVLVDRVVPSVEELRVDDVIASLQTEDGLSSLEFFADVFGQAPRLAKLDLSDNAVGTRGVERLAPLFRLATLRELRIENCGMSQEVAETLKTILLPTATPAALLPLTRLALGRNQMGPGGAQHVGELLEPCTALQHLEYNGARPGTEGTLALLRGLATMVDKLPPDQPCELLTLNLHDCNLPYSEDDAPEEATAVNYLLRILSRSPKLEVLSLQDTGLGAEGLERVLETLVGVEARLLTLRVGGCELEKAGAKILSQALSGKYSLGKTLQELNVDNNELDDEAFTHVWEAARECPQLRHLSVEGNELSDNSFKFMEVSPVSLGGESSVFKLNIKDNMDLTPNGFDSLQRTYDPETSKKIVYLVDEELQEVLREEFTEDGGVDGIAAQLAKTSI